MNEKAGSVLAHRCDICKELQPHLAELVQQPEYDPVQFLTIDVDALPRAAEQACHPRRSSVHRGGGANGSRECMSASASIGIRGLMQAQGGCGE